MTFDLEIKKSPETVLKNAVSWDFFLGILLFRLLQIIIQSVQRPLGHGDGTVRRTHLAMSASLFHRVDGPFHPLRLQHPHSPLLIGPAALFLIIAKPPRKVKVEEKPLPVKRRSLLSISLFYCLPAPKRRPQYIGLHVRQCLNPAIRIGIAVGTTVTASAVSTNIHAFRAAA